MALVTSNQFQLTPSIEPIAQRLERVLVRKRAEDKAAKEEQATLAQARLKTMGAQFSRVRSFQDGLSDPDERRAAFQKQRRELIALAQNAQDRGEPIGIYQQGIDITDPDEMNMFLSRNITRATDADKQLNKFLDKETGGGGIEYGKINYGDYTPESLAKFIEAGGGQENIGLLERYAAPQIVDIGGVPHRVERSGSGELVATPVPLSDLDKEMEGEGAIAGAKAGAATEATLRAEAGEGDAPGRAEVAGQVTRAQEEEKAKAAEKAVAKQNEKAYKTYRVARGNTEAALKQTTTGYFAGKLPAVAASQQIAENAQKILFPAIKALVREAGEGIFTDRDAIDVQAMMPTRDTHPDALPMVMWHIDAYVASKLGQPVPPPPSSSGRMDVRSMTDQELIDIITE